MNWGLVKGLATNPSFTPPPYKGAIQGEYRPEQHGGILPAEGGSIGL